MIPLELSEGEWSCAAVTSRGFSESHRGCVHLPVDSMGFSMAFMARKKIKNAVSSFPRGTGSGFYVMEGFLRL